MKILITGATGFIGSNIAKRLLKQGFEVYATCRNTSLFDKCIQFRDKIKWINIDKCNWKEQIQAVKPDQLIHVAWEGVEACNRNNWDIQIRNFWFSKECFDVAKECGIQKIISFGSQAEYGKYDFPVNEITLPAPNDAYGATKTLTANYLRNLFEDSTTEWYWIRIFSVFGEGENSGWLLPTVISKLIKKETVALTFCEQKYNYLYIEDFLNQLMPIVQCIENKSGIYILCNSESITLKELLIQIANLLKVTHDMLHFGVIPYRNSQSMIITGDNSKYMKCFCPKKGVKTDLTNGLIKTIEYYKQKIL